MGDRVIDGAKRRKKELATGRRHMIRFERNVPEMATLGGEAWTVAGAAGLGRFLAMKQLPRVHETYCTDFISSFNPRAARGIVRGREVIISAEAVHTATMLPIGSQGPDFELSSSCPDEQQRLRLQRQLQMLPPSRISAVLDVAKATSALMDCLRASPSASIPGTRGSTRCLPWSWLPLGDGVDGGHGDHGNVGGTDDAGTSADVDSIDDVPCEVVKAVLASTNDEQHTLQWAAYLASRIMASVQQIRERAGGEERIFTMGRWLSAVIHVCLGETIPREDRDNTVDSWFLAASTVASLDRVATAAALDHHMDAAAGDGDPGKEEEHKFVLPDDLAAMLEDDPALLNLFQLHQEAEKEEAIKERGAAASKTPGTPENEVPFSLRKCTLDDADMDDEEMLGALVSSIASSKKGMKAKVAKLEEEIRELQLQRGKEMSEWMQKVHEVRRGCEAEMVGIKRKYELLNAEDAILKVQLEELSSLRKDTALLKAEVERLNDAFRNSYREEEVDAKVKLEATLKAFREELMESVTRYYPDGSVMNKTLAAYNRMKEQAELFRQREKEAVLELRDQERKFLGMKKELERQVSSSAEALKQLKENHEMEKAVLVEQLEETRSKSEALAETVLRLETAVRGKKKMMDTDVEMADATADLYRDLSLVRRRSWMDDVDEIGKPINWPIIRGDFTSEEACIVSYSSFNDLHKDSKDKVVADAAFYCRKLVEWLSMEELSAAPLVINVNRPMDSWEDVGLYRRLVYLESSEIWEFEQMCKRQFLMGASSAFSDKQSDGDRRYLVGKYTSSHKSENVHIYRADQVWKTTYPAMKKTKHRSVIEDEFICRLKARQASKHGIELSSPS